jgi:hypothetical protein
MFFINGELEKIISVHLHIFLKCVILYYSYSTNQSVNLTFHHTVFTWKFVFTQYTKKLQHI